MDVDENMAMPFGNKVTSQSASKGNTGGRVWSKKQPLMETTAASGNALDSSAQSDNLSMKRSIQPPIPAPDMQPAQHICAPVDKLPLPSDTPVLASGIKGIPKDAERIRVIVDIQDPAAASTDPRDAGPFAEREEATARVSLVLETANEMNSDRCDGSLSRLKDTVAKQTFSSSPKSCPNAAKPKRGTKRKKSEAGCQEQNDALRQRLLTAWEEFRDDLDGRMYYCEVDLATLATPHSIVHQAVHVYWPDEDAWFAGTIDSYNPITGKHKVVYADDDEEELWLAAGLERVRMHIPLTANALTSPGPEQLYTMSQILLTQSQKPDLTGGVKQKLEACGRRLQLAANQEAIQESRMLDISSEGKRDSADSMPGYVVWARAKGFPAWPSLISSKEEAAANGLKGVRGGQVALQAFGDFTWFSARQADVIPLHTGIEQGLYLKSAGKAFSRALFEVMEYLQEGQLPQGMVPDNNNEGFSSDDEEDIAFQQRAAGSKDVISDVKISRNLTVRSFGRIEWIHPAYHNEKHIWPVGYQAISVREAPEVKKGETEFVCEITSASNNAGPLFRISCKGKSSESREGPQRAWQRLMSQFTKKQSKTQLGMKVFGLDHPRVFEHILQMPNSNRCENFCAWPNNAAPIVPKLTTSEKRARVHAEVAMQQLPEFVNSVPLPLQSGACCEACGTEDESDDNPMLQCDGPCRLFVHQACCGLPGEPPTSWKCEVCKTGSSAVPACAVCPVKGGILMRTKCKRYCHAACALWIPEISADISTSNPLITEVDVSHIPKSRKQLSCALCKQTHGACIQCAGSRSCYSAFHVLCARGAGLPMHTDFQLLKNEANDEAALLAPAQKKLKIDGTSMRDGSRLVCYCPRHAHMGGKAVPAKDTKPVSQPMARQERSMQDESSSARGRPFEGIRRGMRAPEALENALAKRKFMQQTPYLVGHVSSHSLSQHQVQQSQCIKRSADDPVFQAERRSVDATLKSTKRQTSSKRGSLSIAQRYWQMRQSETRRVALGKSKIHGWGAISKVAQKKGEMIIEYSGESIRPSLADVRERGMYDQLVGAGTYIFKLNDDFCIDATRAGNMAHMLNHSCQPNCFSRVIQVTNLDGSVVEHVIIFAGEDIPAGQELTYNYRFSSTEELPCNCSAPTCCGLVNATGAAATMGIYRVPENELKPYIFRET